jgi:replicative DNA helicase
MSQDLKDSVAERNVLSAIINYGDKIFFDVDSILSPDDFSLNYNTMIYQSARNLIVNEKVNKIDTASILLYISSNKIKYDHDFQEYLSLLGQTFPSIETALVSAKKVKKFSLCRKTIFRLQDAIENIKKVTGSEKIHEILALAEGPIFEMAKEIGTPNDCVDFRDYLDTFIEHIKDNKGKSIGVSTGFPKFDAAIGGGLRKPGIHVVGGRAKAGKSFLCMNLAENIATQNIPILYLDTELTDEILMARRLGAVCDMPYEDIETGKIFDSDMNMGKLEKNLEVLKTRPFYYQNISGKHQREILSSVRKWIMTHVGFDENGNTNECAVFLDYIKMMELSHAGSFSEWQYIAQMMTDIHNFCIELNIPVFATVQLNRDGITREDQGVVAGSDGIVRLCSSLSLLRPKTEEDLVDDPATNGNRKMVTIASRFGPGHSDGEYINIKTNLAHGWMIEGNLNTENRAARTGVVRNDPNDKGTIEL